jgi:predicted CopG family antitoxin
LGIIDADMGAIGILTITPAKPRSSRPTSRPKRRLSGSCFVDRFSGSLVISGDVASVESALKEIIGVLQNIMQFTSCSDYKDVSYDSYYAYWKTGCGKTSFSQVINNRELYYKKTQAIEIVDKVIDTPGEYLENRRLYKALLVSAVDADLIILLQDCTDHQSMFAPGFATMVQ